MCPADPGMPLPGPARFPRIESQSRWTFPVRRGKVGTVAVAAKRLSEIRNILLLPVLSESRHYYTRARAAGFGSFSRSYSTWTDTRSPALTASSQFSDATSLSDRRESETDSSPNVMREELSGNPTHALRTGQRTTKSSRSSFPASWARSQPHPERAEFLEGHPLTVVGHAIFRASWCPSGPVRMVASASYEFLMSSAKAVEGRPVLVSTQLLEEGCINRKVEFRHPRSGSGARLFKHREEPHRAPSSCRQAPPTSAPPFRRRVELVRSIPNERCEN